MEREVVTSRGPIAFVLTKKNIKKMYLRVKKDGTVSVTAPQRTPVATVDRFVADNEDFIFRGLESVAQRELQQEHSFTSGDRFSYLGENLTLELEDGLLGKARREGAYLRLSLPFHDGEVDRALVQRQVEAFFLEECQWLFPALMRKYQELLQPLGIPEASLEIKILKSRWGSCHRGTNVITLNGVLIHLPLSHIEYVVLHEFCHFIHGNHSSDFYGLVAEYMPDWKERRTAMKAWGNLV